MTDKEKLYAIRAEVERLQKKLIQEKEKGFGSDADDACILELQKILTYIDSLQEEPVSEDLDEAASKYAKEEYRRKSPEILPDRCIGCYAPLMYAFKAGAQWREEQMMTKAIVGIARPYDCELWCNLDSFNLKNDEVCKLIIIKN